MAESSSPTKVPNPSSKGESACQKNKGKQVTESNKFCKKDPKEKNFASTLSKLGSCSSIEEFKSIYSRMRLVTDLPKDCDIHLFRSNEIPLWEKYPQGGMWVLHMKRKSPVLQKMWEELLLAAIGESFGAADVIGVALHTRAKEDSLFVWHTDNSNKFRISETIKAILHLPNFVPIEYRTNKFNMTRRESNASKNMKKSEKNEQSDEEGEK